MKKLKQIFQIIKNKTEQPVISQIVLDKPTPQHLHTWEMVARTYAPPISVTPSENLSEKFAFGVTTLLWECSKCGDVRKEEMLGSDTDTLEELIQKVKKTGPQYIERDGETFIFNKWSPVSSISGNIPLR